MAAPIEKIQFVYVLVSNIPKTYHSSDLRNFFSQFVESHGFQCFHFRHRPSFRETTREDASTSTATDKRKKETFCCVIKVKTTRCEDLARMYHGKHWLTSEGESLVQRCIVKRIKLGQSDDDPASAYRTRKERGTVPNDRITFTKRDLLDLAEMRPPKLMPNGNVGTPTSHFLALINQCKMPAGVIRKLGLVFPKSRGRRIYGSVPFDYGVYGRRKVEKQRENIETSDDDDVRTAHGHRISDVYVPKMEGDDETGSEPAETNKTESEEDDNECEEWDRHEALHDDVTEQERNKERLYEEEIELKWEKGGSGLVFYTDAQYWDELKGDFDEKTSDDWDVDFSIYYEKGSGDMDARDYVRMRRDNRRRKGTVNESVFEHKIGRFERHTKGIGRKLMEREGWKDGQGLGRTSDGIAEALENDGQAPWDRKGFGYHGEKLVRFAAKAPRSNVVISTVYDDPSVTDPLEPLLRTNPQTSLSHRSSS